MILAKGRCSSEHVLGDVAALFMRQSERRFLALWSAEQMRSKPWKIMTFSLENSGFVIRLKRIRRCNLSKWRSTFYSVATCCSVGKGEDGSLPTQVCSQLVIRGSRHGHSGMSSRLILRAN